MKRITVLLLCLAGVYSQDTLKIASGMMYLGEVVSFTNTTVKFMVIDGILAQEVQLKNVSTIISSAGEVLYDFDSGITSFRDVQQAEITYEQTQNLVFAKKISNMAKYNSYEAKNGTLIKIGDTLVVGRPVTGDKQYTEYIGTQEVFSTIMIGGMGLSAIAGPSYYPASGQGSIFTIEKISVSHTKLSKKSPLIVTLTVREPDLPTMVNKRTIGDLEQALLVGEIISPNAPMTRAEAIAKLKESKELLDLEIITQEEYDELKVELTPIIRGE